MKRKGSLVATESVSVDAVKLKFELLKNIRISIRVWDFMKNIS